METEKASHETEESLILAQLNAAQHADSLIAAAKLQNGAPCPEGAGPQVNGDANWNHYKAGAGVNPMKRLRESSGSPAPVPGLYDQGSCMMNGELKQALGDQSLLSLHQPKRIRGDSDRNGGEDMAPSLVEGFPELSKQSDFECNALRKETKLDKRNCNFPNGDIFTLSRNKQMPISNGATMSPNSLEGTPGNLLEKTLSQYYPEHVSIAPQTSGPPPDTVDGQGTQSPSLTSGFPISAQMSTSEPQPDPGASANAQGSNGYNLSPYMVNGFSNSYGDHEQQQQQQQQQQSYPLHGHLGQDQPHPLGQVDQGPGRAPSTHLSTQQQQQQQHQNGTEGYPADSQGMYGQPSQDFNQSSFLEQNTPVQAGEGNGFGPFSGPDTGQHQVQGSERSLQYRMQQQAQCPASLPAQPDGAPGPQQSRHENGMEDMACPATPQRGWIDLNSTQPQPRPASNPPDQTQQQKQMWRSFPPRSQPEQQAAAPQAQGQMLEPDPAQRFQNRGGFAEGGPVPKGFQQQNYQPTPSPHSPAQHNTAPEWQQSNPKGPHMQQPHSQQQMPPHCSLPPQQQGDSRYRAPMQPEHLCETDPDLQEILSPAFLPSQQQTPQPQQKRPLSHPPQFEGQQRKSPGYRPHSQPQPGQPQQQPPPPSPSMRNNGPQQNNNNQNQHDPALFGFNSPMEMPQQQYASCPVGGTPKQYQAAQQPQPNHQRQQSDHGDFPMQAPPHLSQGAVGQMYVKAEPQEACAQYQRGPPGGHLGSQEEFQRHAALRTHLLQRQERHGPPHPPHSPGDFQPALRAVKMENGVRFEAHPQQQLQGREMAMGMGVGVQIKQEPGQSQCEQGSVAERSILATMEQTLRQYQLSPVFERKSLVINSPQRVKVESSGAVTILSTHTDLGAGREAMGPTAASGSLRRPQDFTPKKEPMLQNFMESPMKLLDTPIKNLLDTPIKTQYDIASCHCVEQISEKDEGPYYTHLGAAPNVPAIRETMEKRSGLTGKAIRIEKVIYTGKEGKSTQGCPIAKWVIRRSSPEEKLLVLVRERSGHTCETACIIVVILVWDGISTSLADRLYSELSDTLKKHGALTQRRCAINEERTCACQGLEAEACGASFSFGCSWSMYYNGCKFARSKIPRKFKLLGDDPKEEEKLEYNLQNLATLMGPTYKALAPDAYGNQVEHEHRAPDCRLGYKEGRPFSGVTACLDFCAHSHRDLHNMQGGSTVVCTLTREDNREIGKIPEDEQLHVLPLYKASKTDEFGSEEAQKEKIKSGAIQVLSTFRRQIRMLSEPAKSCRQKKLDAKKAAANKNAMLDTPNSKAEKALQAKLKNSTYESTLQSTPGTGLPPGAMGAMLQPGQHPNSLSAHHAQLQQLKQQQHQNSLSAYPGSPHPVNYPRFPNHPGSFPSTSKPGSMYGPQPTASPYPSPLHVPNSYMNGSNPASPYPGYQCNGGMPLDNYHPYYASNPKHLDMYRQQRPALYPEQQYSAHQRYGVNYPPRYGEPALQVNGFGSCSIRPSVHPMGPYSPYGPTGAPDPQFLDALSIPSSAHPGLDYAAAASKSNQFGGYSNPYLSQSPQMFPSGQDPFRMQIKTEMGLAGVKGLPTQLAGECMTPGTQPGFGLLNGGLQGPMIKQEPESPQTPTTPQKPEVWSDNEHNFLDPDIGGVAVAPSHGSILIECAKRELHATTPLKNPDRNHPTRISLVFYQHKNMNEAKHGLALWEAKMAEKAREKEEEAEKNGGEGTPSKSSKKGAKREHPEPSEQTGEPPYKRFIQTLMERSLSCTTNTYVTTAPYAFTKVTGPYSRFV